MTRLLFAALLLLPHAALALSNAPLHWSRAAVRDNDDAIEHITIRAHASGGHDTFIRFQMANAGFQKGELTVTFRQEAPGGTLYAQDKFPRGSFTVAGDKLQITAGKHRLEIKDGQLIGQFDFASGLQASFVFAPQANSLTVQDRGNGGYVQRDLLIPVGRLTVNGAMPGGNTIVGMQATGFALHDASTCTAHKVYDRSVQLHHLNAGSYVFIDYGIGPEERGRRPLGFVVVAGKGKTFAGEITKEAREAEKVDERNDYQVPWQVTVVGKRGEARAAVRLVAEKQVEREDDLAGLGWVARKAVGAFMHPITYTLKGTITAEVQSSATEEAVQLSTTGRYKYAQVR